MDAAETAQFAKLVLHDFYSVSPSADAARRETVLGFLRILIGKLLDANHKFYWHVLDLCFAGSNFGISFQPPCVSNSNRNIPTRGISRDQNRAANCDNPKVWARVCECTGLRYRISRTPTQKKSIPHPNNTKIKACPSNLTRKSLSLAQTTLCPKCVYKFPSF